MADHCRNLDGNGLPVTPRTVQASLSHDSNQVLMFRLNFRLDHMGIFCFGYKASFSCNI